MEEIQIVGHVLGNGRDWVDTHKYLPSIRKVLSKIQVDSGLSEFNKKVLIDYFKSFGKKRPATVLKNVYFAYRVLKAIGKEASSRQRRIIWRIMSLKSGLKRLSRFYLL